MQLGKDFLTQANVADILPHLTRNKSVSIRDHQGSRVVDQAPLGLGSH